MSRSSIRIDFTYTSCHSTGIGGRGRVGQGGFRTRRRQLVADPAPVPAGKQIQRLLKRLLRPQRNLQLEKLKPGDYQLELTVTDSEGRKDEKVQTFQVVGE